MPVDSFCYLPRILAAYYQATGEEPELPIPWTPLKRPLAACRFGLITSAGLYHRGVDPAFDLERERREPEWGDPSYRVIPSDISQAEIGAAHLHINTRDVLADLDIVLPIHRFQDLAAEGRIGGLAEHHYSLLDLG